MTGLDLLLNNSRFSEHMHQAVLACLLREVAITRAFGLSGTPQSTHLETHRRLFDISVVMEGGGEVHVEIKLDATLYPDQLQRQRENIENSRHEMLYLLLGGAQFVMSGDEIVADWKGGDSQDIEITDDLRVTPGPTIPIYSTAPKALQLRDMITMLEDASPEITNVAVRELADAYRRCLEAIQKTFRSWREINVSQWTNAHWKGFYGYIRTSLFPSSTISNSFGAPQLFWGHRDLEVVRLAVDDFFEYAVHLEAHRKRVYVKLDVLGSSDPERTKYVRKRFARCLQNAAGLAELQLTFAKPRVGQNMTVAILAGDWFSANGSDTLDWNYAIANLRALDLLLNKAVELFHAK